MRLLRFLILVVLLNVIRYVIGFPLESVAAHRLFAEMERHPAIFNNNFTTLDRLGHFLLPQLRDVAYSGVDLCSAGTTAAWQHIAEKLSSVWTDAALFCSISLAPFT